MAQTIKLKRSATAGNEPALNQLELGEIAINTADGKMFIKRDNGTANDPTIVEVGSTASFLPLSGGTLTGNLNLGDNVKAQFGAGDDLEIFSNGSTALLKAGNATSDIRIESDNRIVIADRGFNEAFAVFNDDSDVKLYHDGSQKFATTSTGIDVTGNVSLPDNGKLQLGNQTNGDLQIYHDGSHSYIDEVGTGALIVRANYGLFVKKYSDNTQLLNARTDGAVELFHSGTERLSTTSTGIDVTGSVVADELTVDGTINAYRSGYTQGIQLLGDSGGNQVIGTATNDKSLIIKNLAATKGIEFVTTNKSLDIANNGDISFYDSSGTSQDLFWDSSASSLGIGTTSPSSFVESSRFVVGSGTSGINEMMFLYSGTNAFGAIGFADGTSGTSAYKGTIGYHHDTDEMFFSTNGGGEASRDFTISSSGNATFTGSVTAPTIKSTSHYEGTSYRIYNSTLSNYGRLTADSLGSVIMHTGAGEGARLTPTGLGIGTSSPSAKLQVQGGTSGLDQISISSNTTANTTKYAGIIMTNYANTTTALLGAKAENGTSSVFYGSSGSDHRGIQNHIFYTNASATATSGNTERMRLNADGSCRWTPDGTTHDMTLTADGNLLVGQTTNAETGTGIGLVPDGTSHMYSANTDALMLGRGGSDGEILSFNRSGATIGSIGTFSQDSQSNFFIGFNNGSQDVGLGFGHSSGTGRAYYPCRDNGSGVSDAISLGTATYKYKDLYLSGNTQMGGNLDVVGQIGAYNNPSSSWGQMILRATDFVFKNAGGSIRASIDTSGNLLVGQTTNAETGTGIGLVPDGTSHMYSANTDALMLGRGGSDGEILSFNRSGVTKGNISVSAYGMGFGGGTRSSDFFIKTDGTASFASGVNLGVGTSSPSTNLHSNITSASGAFLTSSSVYALQLSNSDTSAGNAVAMSFGHGGFDYTNFIASVRTGTASNPKGDLVFGGRPSDGASFSERVRLTSGGNLLIGKTADDDSTVGIRMQSTGHTSIVKSGGNCLTLNRLSSDGSLLDFRKDTGTLVGSIESATNTTVDLSIGSGNVRLLFFTNGSAIVPRATSNNSANGTIDLGNSGNKFKDLYLSRRVNFGGVAGNHFAGYDGVTDCLQLAAKTFVRFQTGTNYDEAARLTSSNELLIGCTSAGDAGITLDGSPSSNSVPSMELVRDFSGTATMIRFTNISGSPYVGSISSTTSATAYNTSSDERLKDNIVDAPIASEDIDAIQVRSFDWKADGEHQKYGMVAQELLEVAPDAVTQGDTPDDMMGVDYSKLVPMLIKEIQSLRQRVAQLEE